MSTLYLDCNMGAAGDMLVAALLELCEDPGKTTQELNSLNIPDVEFIRERSEKCGITGTHIRVLTFGEEEGEHTHEHGGKTHTHRNMHGIEHIVNDHIKASSKVRDDILAVYRIIAEAESKVHNTTIENIHFHEVGTMDAVADIAAVCYLLDKLNVQKIYASAIHVGRGTVKCAHGILPVPAPATTEILKGIPIYSNEKINGELCTPTGAALLKYFVKEFRPMPMLKTVKIGYGMGTKDFEIANCLRAFLCEDSAFENDQTIELDFNVDDMTGEEIGFLSEILLKNGAAEVFTSAVQMKKNRPGNLITVLCNKVNEEKIVELIFKYSTTIGLRVSTKNRYILKRKIEEIETEFGPVRKKISSGHGISRSKYEYDDLSRIAKERGISLKEVLERIEKE